MYTRPTISTIVPLLEKTLRQSRHAKGWSLPQLSKRSGAPEPIIFEIEGGSPSYVPSEANTVLLAEALRVPVGLLLGERERLFERWQRSESATKKGVVST